MAFPLYATVGYLVWVLAGQVNENGLLTVFFGLVLIAMGIWVYGRWRAPGASPGRARFGLVGGAVLLGLGAWTGWPQPPAPTDVLWEPWSAERVAQLRAEGRPVYVDFTARWCATCQANKKLVFGSAEVRRVLAEKKFATLRGDWTNRDPKITAELARWGRSAVPFDLVYLPGRPEPLPLPELLTAGVVLAAVRK
jgi:thiol:disulfide interchange protein DsbD